MADARRPYPLSDNEIELLSAYLDGALTDSERAALEARLNAEPALRRELESLRQTVALIKTLPTMKAPRNFTLTREMIAASESTISDAPRMSKFAVRDGMPAKPARLFVFPTTAAFSALSAAAAVILLVIGVGFFTQSQPSTSNNVAMAVTEAATNDEESQVEITGTLDDSVLRQASPAETDEFFLFAVEPETATGESADAFAASAAQPATAQDSTEAQEIAPVDPSAMTGMMAFGTPTPASTLMLIPTMMNTFTPAELTQIAIEAAAAAAMDQAMLEGGGITGAGGAGAQPGGGGGVMEGDGVGGGSGPTSGMPPLAMQPAPSQLAQSTLPQMETEPGRFDVTATIESTGTAAATTSPTMTHRETPAPSPTSTATSAPTLTPTPPPAPADNTPNNLLGIGLIGAALILFALALGTTLIRRARARTR